MRAWYLAPTETALQLELRDVPAPQPKPGELLVRVHAASLNRGELLVRGEPRPAGSECAGEVIAVGPAVTEFTVGMRVMGRARGGFAEQSLLDAREALPVPDSLTWEEAAAVPLVNLVAYDMLVEQGHLAAGEWVLITGVTSGVGVASLQMAKALGARVLGTSRSPTKLEALVPLGLDAALSGNPTDLTAEIRRLTADHGADLVLNTVGGSLFPACLAALAYQGRLATVGHVDGVTESTIDLAALHARRLHLYGVSNKHRTAAERAVTVAGFRRDILPFFATGTLRPLLDRVFPFDELPAARARMEANEHVGKIVVRL